MPVPPFLVPMKSFLEGKSPSTGAVDGITLNGRTSHCILTELQPFDPFRDEAEGFCYVNDIVIGIQRLRARFQRVLYIDLDVHHGNGVENSFSYSKRVFTLSFHQFGPGFYPCSGSAESCGAGSGRGYSANFPYKPHFSGELFVKYFLRCVGCFSESIRP